MRSATTPLLKRRSSCSTVSPSRRSTFIICLTVRTFRAQVYHLWREFGRVSLLSPPPACDMMRVSHQVLVYTVMRNLTNVCRDTHVTDFSASAIEIAAPGGVPPVVPLRGRSAAARSARSQSLAKNAHRAHEILHDGCKARHISADPADDAACISFIAEICERFRSPLAMLQPRWGRSQIT